MGENVTNVYGGRHVASGTVTGYRLVFHKGATPRFEDSADADDNEWAALVSAAHTSQSAFNTAATTQWGSWYTGLSLQDKIDARAAVGG